jgi:hypothetical protein
MNKIILRAITAYSRTDLKDEATPLAVKGREVTFGGKQYVILENEQTQSHVAIYRCMNRGELKRLKRWAAGLVAKPEVKTPVSQKPAILEISPVKLQGKVSKVSKDSKPKPDKNSNQTDLFE